MCGFVGWPKKISFARSSPLQTRSATEETLGGRRSMGGGGFIRLVPAGRARGTFGHCIVYVWSGNY